jgi:hypothetical protein
LIMAGGIVTRRLQLVNADIIGHKCREVTIMRVSRRDCELGHRLSRLAIVGHSR